MKLVQIASAALVAFGTGQAAYAGEIVRHRPAPEAPILSGVTVPADATYLYLSGQVPTPIDGKAPTDPTATYGDTEAQSISVFRRIETLLKAQGYSLGDVVKLTVFIVADKNKGGRQDFGGFQRAYSQFFGTAAQPNVVARSTVEVAALVHPAFLVEIEATAAKVR